MEYTLNDQVVIISGGSQGLGKAFAKKYYEDSNSVVIIVSRSEKKLKQAALDIAGSELFSSIINLEQNSCRMLYHPCDLSDAEHVTEMFNLLERKNIEVTQSFICAGGAIPKLFTDLSLQEIGTGIDINYKTAAYLAHGSLLHGVKHLVFFSSSAAVYPFIGYGQYAPTKAALRSLVATLRQEHQDVRISCVYAGNFASEGFEEENRTKPDITRQIEGASEAISCSDCCEKIMKGLLSGYDDVTTDLVGWLLLACSMGFNTHDTKYFLWPIGWLIAPLMHLVVIPIYMYMCHLDIRNWQKRRQQAHGSEQRKESLKKE